MSYPGATAKPLALLLCAACLGPWAGRPAQAQPGPGYRINGQLAPQVQANPVAAQLQVQLRSLKSSLQSRARATTLGAAIETSLLNSPDLARAYALIQGDQWNLIAVRRQWYPSLNATSSALPAQNFSTTTSSGPNLSTTQYTNTTNSRANLALSWSFFDLSRGPSIKAAGESLRQQQLLFDVSARQLVLSVQQTYFQLQERLQLIGAYDEILANTDQQVQLTEARFNSGLAHIAQVEQIRAQQYATVSSLISLYQQLLVDAAQLGSIMALPPGTLALPAEPLGRTGSWTESLPATIDQALRLREEIQASLAAAASSSWTATSLFNSYWPQFSLEASGGVANANATSGWPGTSLSSNNTNHNWDGGVGLGFSWRLFDGGIRAAQARKFQAQALLNQNDAAIQRLNVTREVEQAYGNYLTSQLGLQSSKAQTQAARQAVIAVQERFKVGVDDMTTVVQTLNLALQAANAYANALRTHNTAVASLYRYSARWPDGTQAPLQQRINSLKQQ